MTGWSQLDLVIVAESAIADDVVRRARSDARACPVLGLRVPQLSDPGPREIAQRASRTLVAAGNRRR